MLRWRCAEKHPLAENWAFLESAWWMCLRAAQLYDAKNPSAGPKRMPRSFWAGAPAFEAATRAVLTHGGMGYAKEYQVERLVPRSDSHAHSAGDRAAYSFAHCRKRAGFAEIVLTGSARLQKRFRRSDAEAKTAARAARRVAGLETRAPGDVRVTCQTRSQMPGLYFEEFSVGQKFVPVRSGARSPKPTTCFSARSRTIPPPCIWMRNTAGRTRRFGQRIVNSAFTLGLMVGISIGDTTLGTTVANLGWDTVRFPKPVFHGDTLRIESEVLEDSPRAEFGGVRRRRLFRRTSGMR